MAEDLLLLINDMKTYNDKDASFEEMYITYFSKMKFFAKEYVIGEEDSENIVHDVFADLWERWDIYSSSSHIHAYLLVSLKNKCLDFLRHQSVIRRAEEKLSEEHQLTLDANLASLEILNSDVFFKEDIHQMIREAIDSLPEKCREIFIKNKLEGKKQKEIASMLNISINTVESQMEIAYRKLRHELKDLFSLLLFFLS